MGDMGRGDDEQGFRGSGGGEPEISDVRVQDRGVRWVIGEEGNFRDWGR